jgi:hypothetical protein
LSALLSLDACRHRRPCRAGQCDARQGWLLLGTAIAAPLLAEACTHASCDALCSNAADKCSDKNPQSYRNTCLEQCAGHVNALPAACNTQRDDLLSCVATAPSVNCDDPQSSQACTPEAQALNDCVKQAGGCGSGAGAGSGSCTMNPSGAGSSGSGSSGSGSSGSGSSGSGASSSSKSASSGAAASGSGSGAGAGSGS